MDSFIGLWDVVLIAGVSLQATALAYIYNPKLKAIAYSFPIPFTLSSLALGSRIDATNPAGLILLLLFTEGVRVLHVRCRVPIVASIVISALIYCACGWALAKVLPGSSFCFWTVAAGVTALGLVLSLCMKDKEEQGHKSPMPIWQKLPAIAAVICLLVLIKAEMRGFMTVFPMVGVVGAYEARKSLWTIVRQIPTLMLSLTPMMMVIRIAEVHFHAGIGISLALGWVVMLLILLPLSRKDLQKASR